MSLKSLLAAGLLPIALIACGAPEESAAPPARLVQVETVELIGPQRRYEFVGRVEARRSVDLAFQVGGQLAALDVTDGLEVAEGDRVAQLVLDDFQRAEREARVQLQQARTNLERQQTLFERGIASAAAKESAQTEYDLRVVALGNARQNLQNATLTAPFSGLVSRVLVDDFAVLAPGQPVARIQDLSELRISIPIAEDLIATFNADDLVSIEASFTFLPDQRFRLEPRELVSEADSSSQTYRGIFALPANIPANILPGMSATVYADLSSEARRPGHVHVPVSALGYAPDGSPIVFVYDDASGTVMRRTVTTGELTNDEIRVTAGIEAGDAIVTAGVSALQDGMAVRPLDAPATRG